MSSMCIHESVVYLDKLRSFHKLNKNTVTIANVRKTHLLVIVSNLKLFLFNVLTSSFYNVEPLILHMFIQQILMCLKSFKNFLI